MKRICCFIFLAVAFLPIFPGGGMSGELTQEVVAMAASAGLGNILQQIPPQEIEKYGFRSLQELGRAQPGTPLEIFTVKPDELLSSSGTDLNVLLRPTGEWYVPVLIGTEYRALLTVAQVTGKWEVFGISAAGLARELEAFNRKLPAQMNAVGAQPKGQPKFIRVFQTYSDFMYVPADAEEYLFPFSSALTALGLGSDKLLTPLTTREVIPILKVQMQPGDG